MANVDITIPDRLLGMNCRYKCELYKTCENYTDYCQEEGLKKSLDYEYECIYDIEMNKNDRLKVKLVDTEECKGFDPELIINKAFKGE